MRNKDEEVLIEYSINKKTVIFWCSGIIENNSVAMVLNKFLYDFSKGKNVFFYGYRLPEEELPKMIDTNAILDKAETICNPFHVFLKLSDAKINLSYFDRACETITYYYDDKIKWTDFLATSSIGEPIKYIKKGALFAYFASTDQGADFWFECRKDDKEAVLALFHTLSELGCRIKQVLHLSFP